MKWRCAWCGKQHESNDPPCTTCGHGTFEEAAVPAEPHETVDTGTQYTWNCTNCGRQHVKNNPPCARCGGHDLERAEMTYEDVDADLAAPGWLEVARPYAPVIAVLVLAGILFGTGIVSPSILPGIGPPTPPDAPGASDEAAGFDLEELETDAHERLEAEREAAGTGTRPPDAGLAGIAEYRNRQDVVTVSGGQRPPDPDPAEFDLSCTAEVRVERVGPLPESIESYRSASALADAVSRAIVSESGERATAPSLSGEGIDVHVYESAVYVQYATC